MWNMTFEKSLKMFSPKPKMKCTYLGRELDTLSKEELIDAVKTLAKLLEETRQNLLTALEMTGR